MGARSKAGVEGRSIVGTARSNPTGGIDICLLWVVWVISATGRFLVQRIPEYVCH
jgi:hypothetical protein